MSPNTNLLRGVPKVNKHVDVRRFTLSTQEAYLLTCIDGVIGVPELAAMTGLGISPVQTMLQRFEQLGLIKWTHAASAVPMTPNEAVIQRPRASHVPDDEVEIDEARRGQIETMLTRLETDNYYVLLGVKLNADKDEIRKAYFSLSKLYHPDSMYGKKIGAYRGKMEKIFAQLSEAYEILGKHASRTEYDQYLKSQANTHVTEELFSTEVEADTPTESSPVSPIASAVPSDTRSSEASHTERFRQVAAKRLLKTMGRSLPPAAPTHGSTTRQAQAKQLAREVLSLRKGGSAVRSGIGKATHFLRAAKDAEQGGDLPAAMNALRLAKGLAPKNPDIATEYVRVRQLVAEKLLGDYVVQARYEERRKKWGPAADSWAKVADMKPEDAPSHRYVAMALLEGQGDMRRAQKYAKRAVELDPENPENRTILAKVFMEQGLKRNAQRELEEGLSLSPHDATIKELLKQVKQGAPTQ